MWPFRVVDVAEHFELVLEILDRGGRGLGSEPAFEGLVEPFDFPAGCGWFGVEFFCLTPSLRRCFSKLLRPPFPPANRAV